MLKSPLRTIRCSSGVGSSFGKGASPLTSKLPRMTSLNWKMSALPYYLLFCVVNVLILQLTLATSRLRDGAESWEEVCAYHSLCIWQFPDQRSIDDVVCFQSEVSNQDQNTWILFLSGLYPRVKEQVLVLKMPFWRMKQYRPKPWTFVIFISALLSKTRVSLDRAG